MGLGNTLFQAMCFEEPEKRDSHGLSWTWIEAHFDHAGFRIFREEGGSGF